ncbi:MAG: efflux transporter outer membrane subunit [Casimicrobiaceae bacterium]
MGTRPAPAHRAAAAALAALVAGGCTVGPDYVKPQIATPPAWRIDYPQAADIANPRWWEQFGDPVLTALVEEALLANRDIEIAAARVDAFIGQLDVARSRFYPQANYSFDASRNRTSRVGVSPLPPDASPYYSLYQGALGANWQLDLFGRVRRESEAARARVYASEQGRRGVVLSVVAGVAASYITLRALDRQLEISRQTAQNYLKTLRIFELRKKGGVVSKVELSQVQSQYLQAQAAIPGLEQQIAAQENLIAVLLGRDSYAVPRGRSLDALATPGVPPGLPSSLLERRPDILAAEQTLVATNADIGAAKAQYFPQFSLTASLGSISTAFGNFLSGPATTWALLAGVAGPIFNAGAIAGQVRTAEAGRREALATYQRTILAAFQETNDALVGTLRKREEAAAQSARVAALREYARLSRLKFDNGYAGYLEVLYAENELFGAELSAVRSQADGYTQLVAVYRAMGGGWIDEADGLTQAPGATPLSKRVADQPMY